jgi:phosphohistidine phosphatase
MKLYVMRHGPAEDRSATGRDQDRALTPSGRDRVRTVARLLADAGEMPHLLLSSSLVRAVQTAEIVAVNGRLPVEIRPELAPGGRAVDLVEHLRSEGSKRPVLIGHEPDLSSLVDELLGSPLPVPMDKAMVVALHLKHREARATLRFILDPRAGEIIHDAR